MFPPPPPQVHLIPLSTRPEEEEKQEVRDEKRGICKRLSPIGSGRGSDSGARL